MGLDRVPAPRVLPDEVLERSHLRLPIARLLELGREIVERLPRGLLAPLLGVRIARALERCDGEGAEEQGGGERVRDAHSISPVIGEEAEA